MKVSIVIPTLNEHLLLPGILETLLAHPSSDVEVIVADADSSDGTADLARQMGAIVTRGGRPAVGRNRGAGIARGDYLFFLDADVKISADFAAGAWQEMASEGMELATARFEPDAGTLLDEVLFGLANLYVRASARTDPHAPGFAIFVKRELFERVGGFDESLHLAEDHDFVKRAAVHAPLKILRRVKLAVNVRRLAKEGRFAYAGKCIRVEMHRLFRGEIEDNSIEYEFGCFDEPGKGELNRRLEGFRERILALEHRYQSVAAQARSLTRQEAKQAAESFAELAEAVGMLTQNIRDALVYKHKRGKDR